MNNKKLIQEGHYQIIASIPLEFEGYQYGIPCDVLLNKFRRIHRVLKVFNNTDTRQMAFDFPNTNLSLVETNVSGKTERTVVLEGLSEPFLGLTFEHSKSSSGKQTRMSSLMRAQAVSIIEDASRIAKKMSRSPLSASQVEDLVNKTQHPEKVRKFLGEMTASKTPVTIEDEVLTIGGHDFKSYCIDGESQTFHGCEILQVDNKGLVTFDVSKLNGFELRNDIDIPSIEFEVKVDSLDFTMLAFAYAAKLPIDVEVIFTQHVVKLKRKCLFVQIHNRNKLSEGISKYWSEITQKLTLLG